jgi:hypothetical protein
MGGHYTVVWTPELRRDVATRWLQADRTVRVRLTAASDRLDRELRFAPGQRGITLMHRPGFRLWSIPDLDPPVLALYEVREGDRLVIVHQLLGFRM